MAKSSYFLPDRSVIIAEGTLSQRLYNMRALADGPTSLADLHPATTLHQLWQSIGYGELDLLLTNTADASPAKLALLGLAGQTAVINRSAVRLTREMAVRLGASVGGYIGALPFGMPHRRDSYAQQAAALAAGEVDVWWLGGFSEYTQLAAALHGVADVAPHIPVIVNFTLPAQVGSSQFVRLRRAVRQTAAHHQVIGIGVDGGGSNQQRTRLLAQLHASQAARDLLLAVTLYAEDDVPPPFAGHALLHAARLAVEGGARIIMAGPDSVPPLLPIVAATESKPLNRPEPALLSLNHALLYS